MYLYIYIYTYNDLCIYVYTHKVLPNTPNGLCVLFVVEKTTLSWW